MKTKLLVVFILAASLLAADPAKLSQMDALNKSFSSASYRLIFYDARARTQLPPSTGVFAAGWPAISATFKPQIVAVYGGLQQTDPAVAVYLNGTEPAGASALAAIMKGLVNIRGAYAAQ